MTGRRSLLRHINFDQTLWEARRLREANTLANVGRKAKQRGAAKAVVSQQKTVTNGGSRVVSGRKLDNKIRGPI